MDDRISKGRAGADIAPIGLNVKSDSIELDNEEIYFADLAHWVRQVYEVRSDWQDIQLTPEDRHTTA